MAGRLDRLRIYDSDGVNYIDDGGQPSTRAMEGGGYLYSTGCIRYIDILVDVINKAVII